MFDRKYVFNPILMSKNMFDRKYINIDDITK